MLRILFGISLLAAASAKIDNHPPPPRRRRLRRSAAKDGFSSWGRKKYRRGESSQLSSPRGPPRRLERPESTRTLEHLSNDIKLPFGDAQELASADGEVGQHGVELSSYVQYTSMSMVEAWFPLSPWDGQHMAGEKTVELLSPIIQSMSSPTEEVDLHLQIDDFASMSTPGFQIDDPLTPEELSLSRFSGEDHSIEMEKLEMSVPSRMSDLISLSVPPETDFEFLISPAAMEIEEKRGSAWEESGLDMSLSMAPHDSAIAQVAKDDAVTSALDTFIMEFSELSMLTVDDEDVQSIDIKSNTFDLSVPVVDEDGDPFAGIATKIADDMSLQLSTFTVDEEVLTEIGTEQLEGMSILLSLPDEVESADIASNAFVLSVPVVDEDDDPFEGIATEIADDMSLQLSTFDFDEEVLADIDTEQLEGTLSILLSMPAVDEIEEGGIETNTFDATGLGLSMPAIDEKYDVLEELEAIDDVNLQLSMPSIESLEVLHSDASELPDAVSVDPPITDSAKEQYQDEVSVPATTSADEAAPIDIVIWNVDNEDSIESIGNDFGLEMSSGDYDRPDSEMSGVASESPSGYSIIISNSPTYSPRFGWGAKAPTSNPESTDSLSPTKEETQEAATLLEQPPDVPTADVNSANEQNQDAVGISATEFDEETTPSTAASTTSSVTMNADDNEVEKAVSLDYSGPGDISHGEIIDTGVEDASMPTDSPSASTERSNEEQEEEDDESWLEGLIEKIYLLEQNSSSMRVNRASSMLAASLVGALLL